MSEVKVNKISPRSGTTVTLGDSGDTFTIPSGATINNQGTAVNFGATGAASWNTTVKTGDFTAVAGEGYFVNTTSAPITVTLPASPSAGAVVAVADYANAFSTNNLTLARNGSKIGANENNATLKVAGVAVTLIFVDSTQGWIVTDDGQRSTADANPYMIASGGTEVTCGNFKTHIFTGPGTFTVNTAAISAPDNVVEYLVVAGGGSGSRYIGGGGGAGGVRTFTTLSPATPINAPAGVTVSAQAYPITVGAGGAAVGPAGCTGPSVEAMGVTGSNTSFSTIASAGGGGGGKCSCSGLPGGSGGGAGGRAPSLSAGSGNTPPVSPPQGQPGGGQPYSPPSSAGGGGGGATTAGAIRCGSEIKYGGAGGTGAFLNNSFFGPTAPSYGQAPTPLAPNGRYFGGGGGGGGFDTPQPPTSSGNGKIDNGGAGGGGSGTTAAPGGASPNNFAAEAGATNTGGGGGVAGISSAYGNQPGAGGSGIVVIRYRFQ